MWWAVAVTAIVLVLIGVLIWLARKEGISNVSLKHVEKGVEAHEREHEEVDRWRDRDGLDALRRAADAKRRLRDHLERTTGPLRDKK
jgi:hypothetical protein